MCILTGHIAQQVLNLGFIESNFDFKLWVLVFSGRLACLFLLFCSFVGESFEDFIICVRRALCDVLILLNSLSFCIDSHIFNIC